MSGKKNADKTGTEKTGTEKTGTEKTGTEKTGTEKPGTEKPGTEKTGAEKTGAQPVRLRPRAPCPICAKPSVQRYHPFCSVRCADVDLGRWLGGRYAIPASEPGEDDEETDMPDPSSTLRREP